MEFSETTDRMGRHYREMKDGENSIPIGPPEGLMEVLELPEPFATNLHNALYRRGIFNYKEASRNPNSLIGALQEAFALDAQRLMEAYYKYEKEVSHVSS